MKVLHLTNHVQRIGNGIVNAAVDLACDQAGAGHEVHFGSSGGEYEEILEKAGVHHHRIPVPKLGLSALFALLSFQFVVRRIQPEIVHSHMVAWSGIAKVLSAFNRYATVSTVHYIHKKASRLMGRSDAVVALGEACSRRIEAWGVPSHRIHVMVNAPLASRRLSPVESLQGLDLGHPAIVSVGGLFHHKGFSSLIEAFKDVARVHPAASLHIVGNGPDRSLFERQAQEMVPGKVTFHGFQSDPRSFMKSADVFVLASEKETFPLVLLECRELARKIVATDVDGNREALDEGKAGWLVAPGSPSALRDGILLALESEVPPGVSEGLERFQGPKLMARIGEIYQAAKAARA